jgi:hypothetical protein
MSIAFNAKEWGGGILWRNVTVLLGRLDCSHIIAWLDMPAKA